MKNLNIAAMMKQAQMMQSRMQEVQDEVGQKTVEASAGGGMVTVKISGELELKELTIDPGAVDPEDVEMLQDLVLAAVRDALDQAKAVAEQKVGQVTGGLRIPGL